MAIVSLWKCVCSKSIYIPQKTTYNYILPWNTINKNRHIINNKLYMYIKYNKKYIAIGANLPISHLNLHKYKKMSLLVSYKDRPIIYVHITLVM
jgi:hypothetical protein